jgi:uncharacterized protein YndB with AHSA1/START domain
VSRVPTLPFTPGPITCSLRIAAPARAIFDVLSDPQRHPEFDGSGTLRATVRGPRRLVAGSRFAVAMRYSGVPYTITNTVTEHEPDRLIAWTHVSKVVWRFQLEPVGSGTETAELTQVTQTWDPTGAPATAGYRLLGFPGRTAPAMLATLERIKAQVEA